MQFSALYLCLHLMATMLAYYLFLLPISYMPNAILYRISDIVFVVLAHIVRYRRTIITNNLKNSFPEKSAAEIIEIRNKFYRHLSDLVLETVKNFTISENNHSDNFTYENKDLLEDLEKEGISVIIMGGHYGNWERYATAGGSHAYQKDMAIYKPFKNKFIDRKMKIARERFGMQMISMLMTKKYFLKDPSLPKSITFAMDQWTPNPRKAYWTKFLNQDTSFYPAAEILAKEHNWAVVYCRLEKKKRGHYHAYYELITKDPSAMKDGEIMEIFVKKLEKTIIDYPPHWLWSHKRWKMSKEEVFGNS